MFYYLGQTRYLLPSMWFAPAFISARLFCAVIDTVGPFAPDVDGCGLGVLVPRPFKFTFGPLSGSMLVAYPRPFRSIEDLNFVDFSRPGWTLLVQGGDFPSRVDFSRLEWTLVQGCTSRPGWTIRLPRWSCPISAVVLSCLCCTWTLDPSTLLSSTFVPHPACMAHPVCMDQ